MVFTGGKRHPTPNGEVALLRFFAENYFDIESLALQDGDGPLGREMSELAFPANHACASSGACAVMSTGDHARNEQIPSPLQETWGCIPGLSTMVHGDRQTTGDYQTNMWQFCAWGAKLPQIANRPSCRPIREYLSRLILLHPGIHSEVLAQSRNTFRGSSPARRGTCGVRVCGGNTPL